MSGMSDPQQPIIDVPETKIDTRERLQREGRWWKGQAVTFKDRVFEELHEAGIYGAEAERIAWAEVRRRYPPLPPKEEAKEEAEETSPEEEEGVH